MASTAVILPPTPTHFESKKFPLPPPPPDPLPLLLFSSHLLTKHAGALIDCRVPHTWDGREQFPPLLSFVATSL